MTAREEQIRKEASRYGGDDCSCAACYLLRLLDAERAKVAALTARDRVDGVSLG